jgi:hypothetical protein
MSQNTVAMGGIHIGIEAKLLLQAITFEEDRDIPNLKTFAYMVVLQCCLCVLYILYGLSYEKAWA